MASKSGAYDQAQKGTDFRRTWDKAEYEERARKKDEEERDRMKEVEEALKKGKKPPRKRKEDLPKPTELMKQHEDLDLNKNLNKTMVVQGGTRGPGAPGFYCDVCNRTSRDSSGYLDHLNSRYHLRKLGQKTQVAKSTLDQVRAKIAALRESTKASTTAKQYDFDQRLREIRESEKKEREERRAKRKREREEKRAAAEGVSGYKKASDGDGPTKMEVDGQGGDDDEMMKLMGFSGGFKTAK